MADSNNNSGKSEILKTLASSGDNWVKIGTLILVALSGGGNLFATKQAEGQNQQEMQRVLHQIQEFQNSRQIDIDRMFKETHELHSIANDIYERQKQMAARLDELSKPR